MTHLTKSKIILYLAIIFVAGGVTGAVISLAGAKKHRPMGPPDPAKICEDFQHRLQSELDLTPAQVQQLKPLLEKRVVAMGEIHSRTVQEIEALIRRSNEEMAVALALTPTQKAKLEQMEEKRREFMQKHLRPPGPPPPH